MATLTFRNLTTSVSVDLASETCCNCGVVFAMPRDLMEQLRKSGGWFYCPTGHKQHYTESEADRLRRELAAAEKRLTAERGWSQRLSDSLETERKRHASTKGQLTKTRNRIQNGVCPDCHRHFVNVERHMASKHGINPLTRATRGDGGR